jgi:hypothetical protein
MTEPTIESLTAKVQELEAEVAALKAALKVHKGHATRARNEAAALRLEVSPEARPCGPLKRPANADEAAARRARIAEALASDHVDVVASDGRKEIVELNPVRVNGNAWRERSDGFLLTLPLDHEPGDIKRPEVVVRGYGLFDAGGEQIGWRALPEPVRVPKNQRVRVESAAIF